ncbi:hypothetical protein LINGRAHAP2_LOCUS29589 [Linum grandiflorum]
MEREGIQQAQVLQEVDQQLPVVPQQVEIIQQLIENHNISEVWGHFDKIRVHGILKAKCHYCKQNLGYHPSNGTSHLWRHSNACIQKKMSIL